MTTTALLDGTALRIPPVIILILIGSSSVGLEEVILLCIVVVTLDGTGTVGLIGSLILEDADRSDGTLGGGGTAHPDGGYGLIIVVPSRTGGGWRNVGVEVGR
jgi:hypothetical protein